MEPTTESTLYLLRRASQDEWQSGKTYHLGIMLRRESFASGPLARQERTALDIVQ